MDFRKQMPSIHIEHGKDFITEVFAHFTVTDLPCEEATREDRAFNVFIGIGL